MLCELFNDSTNKYHTQIMIGLREVFYKQIDCAMEYVLTPDVCKTIMSSMKTKLCRIVLAYMLSSNGSDMAKFDTTLMMRAMMMRPKTKWVKK